LELISSAAELAWSQYCSCHLVMTMGGEPEGCLPELGTKLRAIIDALGLKCEASGRE